MKGAQSKVKCGAKRGGGGHGVNVGARPPPPPHSYATGFEVNFYLTTPISLSMIQVFVV